MPDQKPPPRTVSERFQAAYVCILLRLLPHLINLFRYFSAKIRAEIDYLQVGCTFMLTVDGTNLSCICQRTNKGTFKRVVPTSLALDVAPGSGQPSIDMHAVTVDYVIAFRSLSYAFTCFTGGKTLKDALSERAFSTRGPNSTGVSLTYLFTALLKMFFGWRAAYRTR